MSSSSAARSLTETPSPAAGTAKDAENAIRQAEMQLLGSLIQTAPNDHLTRVDLALAAIPVLDQAQAIADGLGAAEGLPSLQARIASTRARVYDTGRRILEDAGAFDPHAPPEAWRECAAQAVRWRQRVTEVVPQQPTGWLDLGIALQGSDPAGAQEAFQRATELDPSGPVGRAAAAYLDGSIASGRKDSIPGLPRPPAPKAEPEPVKTESATTPAPAAVDPRTERRKKKYLGSIEMLATTESLTRSHLDKLRAAAKSAPDSPEIARAIAEAWIRHGEALRTRKDFEGAGHAFLEARAICPTLEGIEELVVANDKERATRSDRKVRLIATVVGAAIAAFVVIWEITHYVPKD